jgi:hypothetical protein
MLEREKEWRLGGIEGGGESGKEVRGEDGVSSERDQMLLEKSNG